MVSAQNFHPNKMIVFNDGPNVLRLHIEDSKYQFAWQLEVNGNRSRIAKDYDGILYHNQYYVASSYWLGTFPPFVPFKINLSHQAGGVALNRRGK